MELNPLPIAICINNYAASELGIQEKWQQAHKYTLAFGVLEVVVALFTFARIASRKKKRVGLVLCSIGFILGCINIALGIISLDYAK